MTITCTKISGTGNTFLFFDVRKASQAKALYSYFKTRSRGQIARTICDAYHSVGADGVVFVEKSVQTVNKSDLPVHLQWDFYNADGSNAEMCGNASRCMALYAHKIGVKKNPLRFKTRAGVVSVSSKSATTHSSGVIADINVAMPQISALELGEILHGSGGPTKFAFVNSGVPHAVIEVKFSLDPKKLNDKTFEILTKLDKKFKNHGRFKPHSTNVTFYKIVRPGVLESLTFERGVRGYTQACGTGAVAAALAYRFDHLAGIKSAAKLASGIKLSLPGGKVTVDLTGAHPHLIGPAKEIADIKLSR